MQTTEQTTRRKALGIGAKAGAVAMALLITLGSSGEIGAQPPSGGDTHQRQCRKMYDDAADLIAEYKRVGLANPNSPRLTAILFELTNLGLDWERIGCKDRYGSIAVLHQPNGQWVDPGHLGDLGEWVPTTEPTSGATITPVTDEHGSGDTASQHKGKGKKGKKGKRGRR